MAAQDASLPSPRLSPTLAAAHLFSQPDEEMDEDEPAFSQDQPGTDRQRWLDESQTTEEDDLLNSLVADELALRPDHRSDGVLQAPV